MLRVIDFRMKLHAVQFLRHVLRRPDGIVRAPGDSKPLGKADNMIAVAVPNREAVGTIPKKLRALLHRQFCTAIFAPLGWFDLSPERMRQPLHAVTNSENGDAQLQNFRVTNRGGRVVHGTWPT